MSDYATSKSTLSLYGYQLPLGYHAQGETMLHKDFSFKPFNFENEKECTRLRQRKDGPGNHDAKIATEVLAHMLESWGGDTEFHRKKHEAKVAILRSAYMEDIVYAWICLRIEAMTHEVAVPFDCTNCDAPETEWVGDLNDLTVHVSDELPTPLPLDLKRPISWGEKTITGVKLYPIRWRSSCDVKDGVRTAGLDAIKEAMVTGAIHCFATEDGSEYPVQQRILDQMWKFDRERINKAYTKADFPKVELKFDMTCESCGLNVKTLLDWTWDFFFGASSLPKASIL